MARFCTGLVSVLFLFGTTLVEAVENNATVIWRPTGGSVSIQCRLSQHIKTMILLKGLRKESQVLYMTSNKSTITENFSGRLTVHGDLPNVDVVISKLTPGDTGPYWCSYQWFDIKISDKRDVDGNGSVLLVVSDEQQCGNPNKNLLLVIVVVSAAVLFGVFIAFLLWVIPKIKRWHAKWRLRNGVTNDVYEVMRGTQRP
ncbi:uncharacterized protein LOC144001609 isoform X2 [Festucalex cinctus]